MGCIVVSVSVPVCDVFCDPAAISAADLMQCYFGASHFLLCHEPRCGRHTMLFVSSRIKGVGQDVAEVPHQIIKQSSSPQFVFSQRILPLNAQLRSNTTLRTQSTKLNQPTIILPEMDSFTEFSFASVSATTSNVHSSTTPSAPPRDEERNGGSFSTTYCVIA